MQIYLVGGAVRDALLGLQLKDRDWVVVGATPEDMLALGMRQVGADFPVFLHPDTNEEYALARRERKIGVGYHGFKVDASHTVTLEEDLLRRDLTINAMAFNAKGDLIDPYNGKADLRNRLLRHVSLAFIEDPLRVLRIARFKAQLADFKFKIAKETQELLRRMSSGGELHNLVSERVWLELQKALSTKTPSIFFLALKEVGALAEIFPELDKLFEVPQSPVHHPEGDAGTHTMMVLDMAAKLTEDVDVRFAALVHDLGKGVTSSNFWPKHPGHEQTGVELVNRWINAFKLPKTTAQLALKATEWHGLIHKGEELSLKAILKVLRACDALRNPDRFKQILLVCEADSKGRLGFEEPPYLQRDFWLGALEALQNIDIQPLAESGLKGEKMAVAVEQLRLARLDNYKTQLHQKSKKLGRNG